MLVKVFQVYLAYMLQPLELLQCI